jgi:hypothetical protein
MKVKFKDYSCTIHVDNYKADNSKAILLMDTEDGAPVAYATVCLAGQGAKPIDRNVFIKDYSENEGMVDALVEAGVICPACIRQYPSGHVLIGEYRLTDKALNLWEDK